MRYRSIILQARNTVYPPALKPSYNCFIEIKWPVCSRKYEYPFTRFSHQAVPMSHQLIFNLSHRLMPPTLVRWPTMLSTSSTNIIVGDTLAASGKRALTFFSSSPIHIEVNGGHKTCFSFLGNGLGHHCLASTRRPKKKNSSTRFQKTTMKKIRPSQW